MNQKIAEAMQYCAKGHQHKEGNVEDVFDGSVYHHLLRQFVQVGDRVYRHRYFGDWQDIALGLSTDGFGPFKCRKHTCWPLILFNYNLPPDVRFHLENILSLGVIPGPKKPKDFCSFLWLFVQEMLRLAVGIPAFDVLSGSMFSLRVHLILVFGDIPAVSMVMCMKGHNGFSPCCMCKITGLKVPNSSGNTHYVPLYRANHPDVMDSPAAVKEYDPLNLPLCSHDEMYEQAKSTESASTNAEADRWSKASGIKGPSMLFFLHSLRFPLAFPYDFMHLIWENLLKNLVLHWTGEFKGLDEGRESYELDKSVWKAIGEATAKAGSTIPSAYGACVPNIAGDSVYISAEMWSFWALYLGPVLLQRRFKVERYYNHFIWLVELLNICLQFEISSNQIDYVRTGFARWVEDYEK